MDKMFDFDNLIDDFSKEYTLITIAEGEYKGGRYIEGERTETLCRGAIVPVSDNKIYQSGGTYTDKDRQLYQKTPILEPLSNKRVSYKGIEYSVEKGQDFSDYANACIYTLKWVGAVND